MAFPPRPWRRASGKGGAWTAGLLVVVVALILVEWVRSAWLCDDAFITLRSVDNLWNGFGLRWNVAERVQVFTHPLWAILLAGAYGIARDPQIATWGLSLLVTAGMIAVLVGVGGQGVALRALAVFATSRAFIDFSTSGLENCLSHLLLVAFWLKYLDEAPASARRTVELGLIASFTILTRFDLALLVLPALAVEARRLRVREAGRALAIAGVPLFLWSGFALTYYGFLAPNPAYAKVGHGLPRSDLATQGMWYLLDAVTTDPTLALVLVLALVASAWRRIVRDLALTAGLLAYISYVAWVGGDFMSGRFLTAPFAAATVWLAVRTARWPPAAAAIAGLFALCLAWPTSPLRVFAPLPSVASIWPWDHASFRHGIIDERRFYYPYTGLVPYIRGVDITSHPWAYRALKWRGSPRVIVIGTVGLTGFYGGPSLHIVDPLGIVDPLTARMAAEPRGWGIGHFGRPIPKGYVLTLRRCIESGSTTAGPVDSEGRCLREWPTADRFADRKMAARYLDLLRVTQGPLLRRDRLGAILRSNITRRWAGPWRTSARADDE